MNEAATILLVEDNDDDVLLMKQAVAAAGIRNPVQVAEDGREAMEYLAGRGKFADRKKYPMPAVALLDLKLPYVSGHEVLKWIRQQPELQTLVVIVLTSSAEPGDLKESYAAGANSYIIKPPTATQLAELAKAFRWYWLEFNEFEGGKRE